MGVVSWLILLTVAGIVGIGGWFAVAAYLDRIAHNQMLDLYDESYFKDAE